jgi:ABC-type lipoprotein export system ATPase subunit
MIYKYYDNKFKRLFILNDIDFEIQSGKFISIIEPSCSGKPALLKITGLLDKPSEGEYFLFDKLVHDLKER